MTAAEPFPATARPAHPRMSLRRRLFFALVGVSAGSVLLAGLITVVFARQAARSSAASEMTRSLAALAEWEASGDQFPNLARLERTLRITGIGVVVVADRQRLTAGSQAGPFGSRGRLPAGVTAPDLDLAALFAGRVDSGHMRSLVFVAQPLSPRAAGVPVVVATRRIGVFPFGRLGPVLVVAAVVASLAAGAVSLWLVRRLTRPLTAMERTARAIAAGDLRARVEDLTGADDELAALGTAIDSMAAELERADGLERAFLMSVSHDLRTPLTSIRGYAEAIAEGAVEDEASRRRAATIIGSEARRLERLVADLLDLARLDTQEFSLRPRSVDATSVVAAAADALQPAAREAGLRLSVRTPEALPAQLDPERLGQIVANLVENALKYAATAVDVEVERVGRSGDMIEVSITDDGPGIDPADRAHIFERLYVSRRQPGRKVGTGLGLAIVHQLARAMGGTVEVSRTPGGQTRFVVAVAASVDRDAMA